MKKLLFPIILIIFSVVLAACGDDEEVTDPALDDTTGQDEQTTEQDPADDGTADDGATDDGTADEGTTDDSAGQDGTQEDSTDLQDRYNFVEFNLDAEFDNQDDTVEVDFEAERNGTEAKYVDRTQDIDLRGDEAIEELDSIFMGFRFDSTSTDDEILTEVLEAFNIPEDATEIDLDIEFSDGTEKDLER